MSTWGKISAHCVVVLTIVLMMAGCGREKNAWETAKTENTQATYEGFLKKYPEGEFSTLARTALGRLEERSAWEAAKAEDSQATYEGFLKKYPEGEFSKLARAALQDLRDKLTPREVVAAIEDAIKDLAPGAFPAKWNWCTLHAWYDFKSMRPAGGAFVATPTMGYLLEFQENWGGKASVDIKFRRGKVGSCKAVPFFVSQGTEAKVGKTTHVYKKDQWWRE